MPDHLRPNVSPPPPVRRRSIKPLMIAGLGVVLAGLFLIVLINIDMGGQTQVSPNDTDNIFEFIDPDLNPLDLDSVIDPRAGQLLPQRDVNPQLPNGSWIRFVDPKTGELAQQYRFVDLDPNPQGKPAGWLRMNQPEAEMFLSDGRVLVLSGDSALAFAPNRKLESGTIVGDVWIRLFVGQAGRAADPDRDTPVLVVRTEEAAFNNFLGEIRCDGYVQVQSSSLELPNGRGLTVLMDDQNHTFQLSMQKPQRIRIASAQTAERSSPEIVQAPIARDNPSTDPNDRPNIEKSTPGSDQRDAPKPSAALADVTFYRLTLNNNVRIRQGNKIILGDELSIVFSMQSKGVNNMTAGAPLTPSLANLSGITRPILTEHLPVTQALAALAIASFQGASQDSIAAPPTEDDVIIDCDGALTIVPITDPNERLASPEDALLTLTGNRRPIHLLDPDQQAEAECEVLLYHALKKEIQLVGSAQHPLWVKTSELHATGERFWYRSEESEAGFVGPGEMTLFGLAAQGQATSLGPRIVATSLTALGFSPQPITSDRPTEQSLHIAWQQRSDLQFDPQHGEGDTSNRIRSAAFLGDVIVLGESFGLEAESIQAGFSGAGSDAAHIETIDAAGDVRAHSLGSGRGELACQDLKLSMAQTRLGRTIPARLEATGQVMTRDDEQTMWAGSLSITFREVPEQTEAEGRENENQFGDFELDKLIALEEAQLQLNDGARVIAERIDADGLAQTAQVTGENILIVQDNLLIDQGTRLEMDRKTNRGKLPGPGRLRIFQAIVPLTLDEDGRALSLSVGDDPPQVNLHWTDDATFDGAHDDGNGAIDFNGSVRVVADPSALEHDTVDAGTLRIEFARGSASDDAGDTPSSKRSIRKMIANGNARLQSRTWEFEDHSDKPCVFYVAGDRIDYNHQTGEALVDSPGTLLIRDERPRVGTDTSPDQAENGTPRFATTGTTSFGWSERMEMIRAGDELFDIIMTADIEVRHLSLDGEKATLTADHLEATVQRTARNSASSDGVDQTALDLGGPAQLVRVRANGLVFLRTTTRDVQCDEFDYDVRSGLARLKATPGGRISVHNRGAVQPFHAEEVLWDMTNDRITIIRAAGAAGG